MARRILVRVGVAAWVLLVVAVGIIVADRLIGGATTGPQAERAEVMQGFELVTGAGEPVTAEALTGDPLLIYFGYAYCPDVCPTSLARMAMVHDAIADRDADLAGDLRPVFISVDPERDTPDIVRDYAAAFHERMLGLTGDPAQTDTAAGRFGVYYRLNKEGPDDDDYLVDHTSLFFLVDSEGRLVDRYAAAAPIEAVADQIVAAMR